MVNNYDQPYRPLRPGSSIYTAGGDQLGTVGAIAWHDDEWWLVSAFHVLVGPAGTKPVGGEPVYQPAGSDVVATLSAAHCSEDLDLAAARVEAGLGAPGDALSVGKIGPPTEPTVGMRVRKVGAATGVTEGVVTDVEAGTFTVRPLAQYPRTYDLSSRGDSGAPWVCVAGNGLVGFHLRGNAVGAEYAIGVSAVVGYRRLFGGA